MKARGSRTGRGRAARQRDDRQDRPRDRSQAASRWPTSASTSRPPTSTLTLKDGKTLGLQLGAKNPTGVWVYARERDKPAVFVLGESVLRDATRPVADFRDRTILAFDAKDVTGLRDRHARRDARGGGRADGAGGSRGRRPLPADSETVREFLDKLAGAEGERVRGRGAAVARRPTASSGRCASRSTAARTRTGSAGRCCSARSTPSKKGVYAMRAGEPSVLLVPEEVWNAGARRTWACCATRSLVEFERDKVDAPRDREPQGRGDGRAREGRAGRSPRPQPLAADQVEAGARAHQAARPPRAGASSATTPPASRATSPKPEVQVTVHRAGRAGADDRAPGALARRSAAARPAPTRPSRARAPWCWSTARLSTTSARSARRPARPRALRRARAAGRQAGARAGGRADASCSSASGDTEWRWSSRPRARPRLRRSRTCSTRCAALRWKEIVARRGRGAGPLRAGRAHPGGGALQGRRRRDRHGAGGQARRRPRLRPDQGSAGRLQRGRPQRSGPTPKVPDDFKG